jgi:hypothetical protein
MVNKLQHAGSFTAIPTELTVTKKRKIYRPSKSSTTVTLYTEKGYSVQFFSDTPSLFKNGKIVSAVDVKRTRKQKGCLVHECRLHGEVLVIQYNDNKVESIIGNVAHQEDWERILSSVRVLENLKCQEM